MAVSKHGETRTLDMMDYPYLEEMKMMDNERFLIIPEKEKGLSSFDPDRVSYTKIVTGMSYGA
jgi:hypothetical protein